MCFIRLIRCIWLNMIVFIYEFDTFEYSEIEKWKDMGIIKLKFVKPTICWIIYTYKYKIVILL